MLQASQKFRRYQAYLSVLSHPSNRCPNRAFSSSKYPSQWEKLATKETGKDPKSLEWNTPEGMIVKPLYTSLDSDLGMPTENVEVPGVYPFKRGPYATMYTAKP